MSWENKERTVSMSPVPKASYPRLSRSSLGCAIARSLSSYGSLPATPGAAAPRPGHPADSGLLPTMSRPDTRRDAGIRGWSSRTRGSHVAAFSPHPGYQPLAAGRVLLVLAAERLGQLPLLDVDPHGQAGSAQDRDRHQAPHVVAGQRQPGEHEGDPGVGGMADVAVRPAGDHPVPRLDFDPVLEEP